MGISLGILQFQDFDTFGTPWVPICAGVLISTQLNKDQPSLTQIDLIELLYF